MNNEKKLDFTYLHRGITMVNIIIIVQNISGVVYLCIWRRPEKN